MAHYQTNIPALPPLASGVNDNAAAGIVTGIPLNNNDLDAARLQHQNRKNLASLNPPLATQAEVVASKLRKHQVQSVHFDGGATPLWGQQMQQQNEQFQQQMQQQNEQFQQQMQQQNQQFQQQMQQNQQQFQQFQQQMQQQNQQMQQQFQQLNWRIQEESARSMNRARRNNTDHIEPLTRMADGASPTGAPHNLWFPANGNDLADTTGPRINALLNFYGLGIQGTVLQRKDRLKHHLQVTL